MSTTDSRTQIWVARVLRGFAISFLLFDAGMKLLQLAPAVEGTASLGYPPDSVFGIGVVELVCIALYIVPRTSFLGAVLLTGYLGGAIATHVRVGHPLFTHILFPTYVAAFIWGALYLRDARLRALAPVRV
jgi:DoxX-like family